MNRMVEVWINDSGWKLLEDVKQVCIEMNEDEVVCSVVLLSGSYRYYSVKSISLRKIVLDKDLEMEYLPEEIEESDILAKMKSWEY